MKYALYGRRRSSTAVSQERKEGFNRKLNKRVSFTLRDPRSKPIPFRLIFIFIYLIGLIISAYAGYVSSFNILLVALFFHYVALIFSYVTANKIIKERDALLERILEFKSNKMRLVNKEKGVVPTPQSEFKVVEWGEDLVSPVKIYLYMPTSFDILEVDNFMESFNLIFGANGRWVADRQDKNYGGFDFNAGVAAIAVTPPLPPMAHWHERYLKDPSIHWSFFPLAIGSENGILMENEETGEMEHVLGFAVNNGQEKLAKKHKIPIGNELVSAPQVLIAGATGGGKSLHSQSKVRVISE